MATRLTRVALFTVLVLAAGKLPAQPERTPGKRTLAATSMQHGVSEAIRIDSLIAGKTLTGELVLVTSRPDRQVPGRTVEHYGQFHRGLPVLGAGLTRQRDGGATVSAFGTIFSNVDVNPVPSLSAAEALVRMEEIAGAEPAQPEPPSLVVLPTPLAERYSPGARRCGTTGPTPSMLTAANSCTGRNTCAPRRPWASDWESPVLRRS